VAHLSLLKEGDKMKRLEKKPEGGKKEIKLGFFVI